MLERTTYLGITDEEVLPILANTALKAGQDFYFGYSLERQDSDKMDLNTEEIARCVSGITQYCLELSRPLYDQIATRRMPVSSARVAEAPKLLENIYRTMKLSACL